MSGSGYNDPEKLAAAQELARSFKSGGDSKHRRGNAPGRTAAPKRAPQPTQKRPVIQNPQPSNVLGPPPPSQRQYGGLGRFGDPSANYGQPPVLGNSAADFLRRVDDKAPAKSVNKAPAVEQGPGDTNSCPPATQIANPTCIFKEQKPEDAQPGSVLDTFFFLVNGGKLPDEKQKPEVESTEDSTEQSRPVEKSTTAGQDLIAVSPAGTAKTGATPTAACQPSATEPGGSVQKVGRSETPTTRLVDTKLSPQAPSFVPNQMLQSSAESLANTAVASAAGQNLDWNSQSFASNAMGETAINPASFNSMSLIQWTHCARCGFPVPLANITQSLHHR